MNHRTRAEIIQTLEDGNVRQKLMDMERNPLLNTNISSYTANTKLYPDSQVPFVEKHIAYLMEHPGLNPEQYLSNLRLRLKN